MREEQIAGYTYSGALFVLAAVLFLLSGCATFASSPEERLPPAIPPQPELSYTSNGSIWAGTQSVLLFEDAKARRVGDLITILLVEKTNASKQSSVNSSKESSTDIGNPTLFGRPLTIGGTPVGAFGLESGQNFSGSGDAVQSNKLEGSITVAVSQVLANGNLVVSGEKNLELTNGAERVSITGIVRPADVSPTNTISSDRVADARITYGGSGHLANSGKAGWLTRFFNSGWMPF